MTDVCFVVQFERRLAKVKHKTNKNFKYYRRDKFPEKVAKARQRSRAGARNQEAVGATKVKICTSY